MANPISLDTVEEPSVIHFPEENSPVRSDETVGELTKVAGLASNGEIAEDELSYHYKNHQEENVNRLVENKRRTRAFEAQKGLVAEISENPSPEGLEVMKGMFPSDEVTRQALEEPEENVVAKEYGKTVAETVALETFAINGTLDEEPEAANRSMDVMEDMATKSAIFRNRVMEEADAWKEKTLPGKIGSFAWGLIPGVDWYSTQNAVEGAPTSTILKGNNISEQVAYLWSLPPDEAAQKLNDAIEDVRFYGGDLAAVTFAQSVIQYSSSDSFWDSAFGVVDVASIIPGAAVVKASKAGKAAVIAKETSKTVTREGPSAKKVANALGDTKKAAAETIAKVEDVVVGPKAIEIPDFLPTLMNPESVLKGGDNVSSVVTNRLAQRSRNRIIEAESVFQNGIGINSISKAERAALAQQEFENIRNMYTRLNDAIQDTKIIPAELTKDNVDRVEVLFSKKDGEFFSTEKAAKSWAGRYLPFKDTEIVDTGASYGIKIQKPIKQGEDLKDLKLTAEQKTPDMSSIMRSFHSDGYVVSPEQVGARRTTSDVSEFLGRAIERLGEPISKLGKKAYNEVDGVNKIIRDNIEDGQRRWLDMDEFHDAFRNLHDKAPTEDQMDAYMAYRQISDTSYVMRDMSLMTHKMRLGVENWDIPGIEDTFEGVFRRDIPWSTENFFKVVVLDKDGLVEKTAYNTANQGTRKTIDDMITSGYSVVESFNGRVTAGNHKATFVLSRDGKRSNIRLGQSVNYHPGGHLINESPWFIKQAQISTEAGKRLYSGDLSLFNVYSQKQGVDIAAKLNVARDLKISGDKKAFREYMTDNFPDLNKKQIEKMNWDQKFHITRSGNTLATNGSIKKGKSLGEGDYDYDYGNSPHNLSSQLSGKFLGERDDHIGGALYSEKNTMVRSETANVLSPIKALQAGMQDAFTQRSMNEYIQMSADRFSREFSDILDVSAHDLARNPVAALTDAKFLSGADAGKVAQAKRAASAINTFIGQPTKTSRAVARFKDKIAEWALDSLGKDSRAFKLVDERLLHTVKDPAVYFRGAAFHTKMGLFNPKQLFLQTQILAQVASIGGVRDTAKSIPAIMYSYSLGLTNKAGMLDDAARRMTKFGWRAEHFKESQKAMQESGWDIIGGSVSWRDAYEGPSLVKGPVGSFLESGTSFFKKGEQIGRVTAWHVAYRNWRKKNPHKVFDREAIEGVRVRASDLTANMTRDMNAQWQRGFLSVPTQFWGFQARVFEQMVTPASRLTKTERLRLFGGLSALYGIPVGVGAGTMVWPINESVKKYMMELDIEEDVENNPLYETLRDGVLSTAVEQMAGMFGEDLDLDTSPYGPAGNPFFKDFLNEDKDWHEVFGGASAGVVADLVGPLAIGLRDAVLNNGSEEVFSVTIDDVLDYLKPISSVNNATKGYRYLQTGKWVTSNQTRIGDMTGMQAIAAGMMGLSPEHITDAYLRREVVQDTSAEIRKYQFEVQKEYSAARNALLRGDEDMMVYHIKRAKAAGISTGLTDRQIASAYRKGFNSMDLDDAQLKKYQDIVIKHLKMKKRVK